MCKLALTPTTDPQRRRQADLRSERERLERAAARLVTAYQEELITLDELRSRMPAIHSRKRVLEAELEAVQSAAEERERFLRIAETLESFRDRLRASTETLELIERQKVLRSLVKEVLVGDGEITIRHSIPMTEGSGCSHAKPDSNSSTQSPEPQGYLLRWRSHGAVVGQGDARQGWSVLNRQTRTLNLVALAEARSLWQLIGRPRYFHGWEVDARGFDKIHQANLTARHNGSGDVQDVTRLDAVSFLPAYETSPVTVVFCGGTELAIGPPVIENRYRSRSSNAGKSVETLALALSAWDLKDQAANGLDTPIQTRLWDRV